VFEQKTPVDDKVN
jgi:hypothetical protein